LIFLVIVLASPARDDQSAANAPTPRGTRLDAPAEMGGCPLSAASTRVTPSNAGDRTAASDAGLLVPRLEIVCRAVSFDTRCGAKRRSAPQDEDYCAVAATHTPHPVGRIAAIRPKPRAPGRVEGSLSEKVTGDAAVDCAAPHRLLICNGFSRSKQMACALLDQ
jgi:hypothetical protein